MGGRDDLWEEGSSLLLWTCLGEFLQGGFGGELVVVFEFVKDGIKNIIRVGGVVFISIPEAT
jgi:hypothetical protein